MSSWTYINANIHISRVKKPFIVKVYNLPKDIDDDEYDDFCNHYKNFKYKLVDEDGSKTLKGNRRNPNPFRGWVECRPIK